MDDEAEFELLLDDAFRIAAVNFQLKDEAERHGGYWEYEGVDMPSIHNLALREDFLRSLGLTMP